MLTWYAQEQPTSCVAACVRMVFTGLGVTWTEDHVRRVLGRPRLGITLTAAQARLIQAGARAWLHAAWNLDDLREAVRRGATPIVGVERHLLGYAPASHAIVVVRVTSRTVEVLDPLEGPHPQAYGHVAFTQAWTMAGNDVLVVEAPPPVLPA
jgi:ABC-type bacteriocin/lantibiotic exporter with double-glycine peptidase domain